MTGTRAATDAGRPPSAEPRGVPTWVITAGLTAVSLIAFVLIWQAIVFVSGFKSFILPGPLTVAERFVQAWAEGTMWPHVQQTLVEVLLGFLLGASIAVAVGVLLARSRLAERLLSPYLVAAQATPVLALAPVRAGGRASGYFDPRTDDLERVTPTGERRGGRAAAG